MLVPVAECHRRPPLEGKRETRDGHERASKHRIVEGTCEQAREQPEHTREREREETRHEERDRERESMRTVQHHRDRIAAHTKTGN